MTSIAFDPAGKVVDAGSFLAESWEELKCFHKVGDLTMPCCSSPAIPKTSINGLQFFAHHSDECASAPETAWHREAKFLVSSALANIGIECKHEVRGGGKGASWIADTLFYAGGRTISIELQRSYQHLRDYIRRQERYANSGVECYWLTSVPNFFTLVKATTRLRMKREFGGKLPASGMFPLLGELPISALQTGDSPRIVGAKLNPLDVADWLNAIVENRYVYDDGAWIVVGQALPSRT